MSVIWEDPPPGTALAERFGRQPSPLRKEADEMLETLRQNEGKWARLWDLETKDEARKRCNYVGVKGFSFSVRETPYGWSVFGRYNGAAAENAPVKPRKPRPEPVPDQPPSSPEPQPEPQPEAVREPTFPE
jgi:hypothetical protein